ncbi:TOBE domain-containing protein, partial [Mesorhizobium sp. M00.F.Ca.ET.217.01.1.1]|uniref:TOBE domain-containing protein n=1 Tax=Mesorhizobium sp. M00.F.Ca.ET.217.01.1.1 TaxID=2500529 RepID=UPI001091EE98
SDRIVVMNAGAMEQIGAPEEVYETPATAFVADFLGKANMLAGTVTGSGQGTAVLLATGQTINVACPRPLADGSKVTVVVRPQKLSVGAAVSANRLSGRVVSASYLGGSAIYEIDVGGKTSIRANAPITGRVLREGEAIDLGFDPDGCVLLDEKGVRIS